MFTPGPAEADVIGRNALIQEAGFLLPDAAPLISNYKYNGRHLFQPGTTGAPPNVLNIQNFKFISLDPAIPVWKGEVK